MPKYEHDNWGDIQDYIFARGTLTAVDSEFDIADVTVPGYRDGSDVPLFYHCSDDAAERSNGAIEGAAAAFGVGDDVMVMCEADTGTPVRIIGFINGIKACEFTINYTINNKTPQQSQTIKIVDALGTEHIGVGIGEAVFSGVVWPAEIFLYGVAQYYRADEEGDLCAVARKHQYGPNPEDVSFWCGISSPAYEASLSGWDYFLNARCSSVLVVTAGEFDSRPEETINFTVKAIKSRASKYVTGGSCVCSPTVGGPGAWTTCRDGAASVLISKSVGGGSLDCPGGGGYSSSTSCFYETDISELSNIAIISDEKGQNPTFTTSHASRQALNMYIWVYTYDEDADEYTTVCETSGGTLTPSYEWEWEMDNLAEGYF